MNKTKYVQLDYFKELAEKAYLKDESFDAFVERMAEKYFPGRSKEWQQRYAFSIRFYGICVEACTHCTGECAHHGHQYHLRIKKGSSCPVPWASTEVCEKYRPRVRPKPVSEEDVFCEDVVPENEPMLPSFDPFSVDNVRAKPKKKYVQQSLL